MKTPLKKNKNRFEQTLKEDTQRANKQLKKCSYHQSSRKCKLKTIIQQLECLKLIMCRQGQGRTRTFKHYRLKCKTVIMLQNSLAVSWQFLKKLAQKYLKIQSFHSQVFICIVLCVHAQLCPTLHYPMDCSPPGSCVHGILQSRISEWVAISYSKGSS